MKKAREVVTYKDYFEEFFEKQSQKVRDKIIKVLDIIEQIERVPVTSKALMGYSRYGYNSEATYSGFSAFSMATKW